MFLVLSSIFIFKFDIVSAASINETKFNLAIGAKKKLFISGTSLPVKWVSSNKEIAKVNKKGKVTALAPGLVTIKAKLKNQTLKCRITVTSPELSTDSIMRLIGKTQYINVLGTDGKVTYLSENNAIATVDDEGLVKMVGIGETKIDVKVDEATYNVAVKVEMVPQLENMYYINSKKCYRLANTIAHVNTINEYHLDDYDGDNDHRDKQHPYTEHWILETVDYSTYDFENSTNVMPVYDTQNVHVNNKGKPTYKNTDSTYTDIYLIGSSQQASIIVNPQYKSYHSGGTSDVRYIPRNGYGIIRIWNQGRNEVITVTLDGYTYELYCNCTHDAFFSDIPTGSLSTVKSNTSSFWSFDLGDEIKEAITSKIVSLCVDAFFMACFGL